MKIKLLSLLFCTLAFCEARAQDTHFTQFYAAPTFINPAFAGANVCSRTTFAYRNQWPGIKTTYTTYLFSFDHCLAYNKMGVGINFAADEAGTGDLKTTKIDPVFSVGVKPSRKTNLRLGIQPGLEIRSIKFQNLLFGDQIYRGGKEVSTYEKNVKTTYKVDLGAGLLFNTPSFWAGVSGYHLSGGNNSFREDAYHKLPLKLSIHSGIKIKLAGHHDEFKVNDKYLYQQRSITFAMHYRKQNKFDQLDCGFYYSHSILNLGIWYRGIPVSKEKQPDHDAVAFLVGINTNRCNIGYSYDLTVSNLHRNSFGSHEITISYQFCDPKKLKKQKFALISCPKF